MARTSIPTLNLQDYLSGDEQRKSHFIQALGDALTDIGLPGRVMVSTSVTSKMPIGQQRIFLSDEIKEKYEENKELKNGFIPFGVENAKDNPSPDLKGWQTGRTLTTVIRSFMSFPKMSGQVKIFQNMKQLLTTLLRMEDLSLTLLEDALYLNKDKNWLTDMATDGNTILRVIHYPPISKDDPQIGSVHMRTLI